MHKTKLIALLLAVAMITSMVVPGVTAANVGTLVEDLSPAAFTPPDPKTVACPCAACNNTVPASGWEVWDGTQTNGHYYLTEEKTLTAAVSIGEKEKLVLNLNGKDVNCGVSNRIDGRKNFYLADEGSLDIMDSSAYYDGSNYVAGAIRNGNANEAGSGSNPLKRGGNICCWGDSAVTIHSGKVTGGTAAIYGGNIYMRYGTLTIYGGEISDGSAGVRGAQVMNQGTSYIYGGTITGKSDKEAFTQEGRTLSIYGGTVGKIRLQESATLAVFGGNIGVVNNSDNVSIVKLYNGVMAEAPAEGYLADCACYQEAADGTFVIWNYKDNCSCDYKTALTSYAQYITVMEGAHTPDQSGTSCTYCKYDASEDQPTTGQEGETNGEPTTGQEGETNGEPTTGQEDEGNGESNDGRILIILLIVGAVIVLAVLLIVKVLKNKGRNKDRQ